jgi:two-component system, NarL family, nitrate/nitrite response regulator NarL
VTPRRHAAPVHLTRRERQVVHLIVAGCSNQEIATRLRIQCQTVKNQLSHIYSKVGVSSRVQLAMYAVKNGLDGESLP